MRPLLGALFARGEYMQCKFYKYAATPNRIDKSSFLTEISIINNISLKDNTDLMQPVFYLKTDPTVYNANYLFCSYTQRYYYINQITAVTGGRLAISCSIDVLYTYRDEILNSTAWIEISSDTATPDYMRQDYPFTARQLIKGIDFPADPFVYTEDHRNCLITFL